MTMGFLIGSHRELRNMTSGAVFRQLEFDVAPAGAALFVFKQFE